MAEIKERFSKSKNKNTYTVCIRLKGYPPITKTFDRKTDAREWASQTESDIRRGISLSQIESQKHTLNELIDRYIKYELPKRHSDQQKFRTHLDWWKNEIGSYYLSNINTALLTQARDKLASEPTPSPKKGRETRTPATVNRYCATLSIVFSFAVRDWEWLHENPMSKLRKYQETNGRTRFLEPEEIATLLENCKLSSYQLYLLVLIALATGGRYGEINKLKWENVDLEHQLFYFMDTKNKTHRGVPITDELTEIIKEYKRTVVRRIKDDYIFARADGLKPVDRRKAFRNALKKSGITDFDFHDLRHTTASHLAMSGKTLSEIAEILGHKTLQMVKRYSHLTQGHTKGVLEDMTKNMFRNVENS